MVLYYRNTVDISIWVRLCCLIQNKVMSSHATTAIIDRTVRRKLPVVENHFCFEQWGFMFELLRLLSSYSLWRCRCWMEGRWSRILWCKPTTFIGLRLLFPIPMFGPIQIQLHRCWRSKTQWTLQHCIKIKASPHRQRRNCFRSMRLSHQRFCETYR